VPRAKFFIRITSTDGLPFFTVYSEPVKVPSTGRLTCEATIPRLMLHGGDYGVWVGVCSDREEEEVILQTHLPLAVRESIPHPERGVFWNNAGWKIS
jgi:hypothetical protein